jgi:hypothetical protein
MPFHERDHSALAPLRDALDPRNAAAAPEIRLRIHGGMPSERLELTVVLHADDSVDAQLLDRLGNREGSERATPSPERLALVREAILESDILGLVSAPENIPPDGVIGELRIDGQARASWLFVADVDQADVASEMLPLPLFRAVGPLVALGKDLLTVDMVGPYLVGDGRGPVTVVNEGGEVTLYNLRPEPVDVGGFEVQGAGTARRLEDGLRLEPHGVLRLGPAQPAAAGAGNAIVVRDRGGNEIARRVAQ